MYARIKASQVPTRGRKSESRFEKTADWKAMKADIDRGLKPQEALQVSLTQEEMVGYGITNRRTIARFVQKYVSAKEMPYTVKSFHRADRDYIVVCHGEQTGAKPHSRMRRS